MVQLRFGTDGVRGVANRDLTPQNVLALGRVAARSLDATTFAIGRDSRISGSMLEAALCAGLASAGAEVIVLGMCPTPAVAAVCESEKIAGAMISASHNPFGDNGVKLFAAGGVKLDDATQSRLEADLEQAADQPTPTGADIGTITATPERVAVYRDRLVESVEGRSLAGPRVVLDCANGAASTLAPEVFRLLGADPIVICAEPDGLNINTDCGSTHLGRVASAVQEHGAVLGFAFDGDADRVLAVDAAGEMIDGDQLIGMCAIDRKARGRLPDDAVAVTVMTNLGFRLGMAEHGVNVHETAVGDRYVLEALEANGWTLGGEQSGHVIFRDLATTGDGILTAIQVLDLVNRSGHDLRTLADHAMVRLPQVLRNVETAGRDAASMHEAIQPDIDAVANRLGADGRVLVRPSGTEPLLRIMVEARAAADAENAVSELIAAVERKG